MGGGTRRSNLLAFAQVYRTLRSGEKERKEKKKKSKMEYSKDHFWYYYLFSLTLYGVCSVHSDSFPPQNA
jgi:hypothetical protein